MYEILVGKSRGGSVGTATRPWAGESGARIPARETVPSSAKLPNRQWSPIGLLCNCYRCSLPVVRRPERGTDQ